MFCFPLYGLNSSRCIKYFYSIGLTFPQAPLYVDAPLTTGESMLMTYLFVMKNNLSYNATTGLLDLIKLHLPSQNFYPNSIHYLRRHIHAASGAMSSSFIKQYCSNCLEGVPETQKSCDKDGCQSSSLSYYALLPFEEHLKHIFSGMTVMHCMHM